MCTRIEVGVMCIRMGGWRRIVRGRRGRGGCALVVVVVTGGGIRRGMGCTGDYCVWVEDIETQMDVGLADGAFLWKRT